MWNKLKESENCRKFRDGLEAAAAKLEGAIRFEDLIALLPQQQRMHMVVCAGCGEAANDLVTVKQLLGSAARFTEEDRPWFAARVLAAIASRETELAERASAWTEFPRFASRLAWVAAILLLAGTTWFYKAVVRAPNYVPAGQESIFETPQQPTPDDVLVSMAGDHP
ncbi:MAG TPA: hypothetical protein VKB90_10155 [Candidatus Acidoferrum sp.]|nr:hypothetical protein [Candidatus Acidoferrum sp.]